MKIKHKLNLRDLLCKACVLLLVISICPLLYIGRYNVMSADDFSMCKEMHRVVTEGGEIGSIFSYALTYVAKSYQTWIGCYAVSFLDVFNPCVFGEQFTWITPVIMVGSILAALYVTIRCTISYFFGKDAHRKECLEIWALLSFLTIQTMPSPSEAFFWYAGAIAYTTLHYLLFVFTALQIWSGKLTKTGHKAVYAAGASLLALIVGGSQYTTGLLAVIETVFSFVVVNRKIKWQQIIPGGVLMIGFGISMCSPGNSMRQSGTTGMAPVKAILLSFVQALHYAKEWVTPLFLLVVLFLLPVMGKVIRESKKKYRYAYPLIVWFFSFCLFAAGFAPSLYGVGNVNAGRIQNQLQGLFYFLLFIDIFYGMGWLYNKCERKEKQIYQDMCDIVGILAKYKTGLQAACFVCLLLVFAGTADKNTFSSISALRSLTNGEAKTYYAEAQERLADYKNPNVTVVEVEPFSVKPHVLYFTDIVEEGEPNYWINENIAAYYGKEKVILRKSQ